MADAEAERLRLERIAQLAQTPSHDSADIAFLIECLGLPRKIIQRQAADACAAAATAGVAVAAPLLAAVNDENATRRWGAAYALARIGPPPVEILPTLLEVMGSNDGDMRWAAMDIVKRLDAAATPALITLAREGNPDQRKMATYCLRDLGAPPSDLEAVCRATLADSDVGVRLAGLALVATLADRTAAAAHVMRLRADPAPGVQRAAISTLGALGQRTPAIEHMLRDALATTTDPGLQRAAERSMRMLGMTVR